MNREEIQAYGDRFTAAERDHAVSELRAWLQLDTWTVREGLLLLVGIDPHRADDLVLEKSGFSTAPQPSWARITARPGLSPDQVDDVGCPRITGFVLDLFQIQLLSRLLNLWVSNPAHTLAGRHAPSYFREWASSKGCTPFWFAWATDAGLSEPVEQATDTTMPAPVVAESVSGGNEPWKEQARARAYEIIKRDKEKDLYPSQVNIADEIAKQFRSDGLMGTDGKPLTGAYIKRHALNGISSAQSKLVSTAMRQSK